LKQIITHLLSLKTSNTLQNIISACIPLLLANEDEEFECFKDYFIALDPEASSPHEISKLTMFTTNLKDAMLPGFSD
jgi:hypothetical protein